MKEKHVSETRLKATHSHLNPKFKALKTGSETKLLEDMTIDSKTTKLKKDMLKSGVMPEAIREKKFVLWQKLEQKNGFYCPDKKIVYSKKSSRYSIIIYILYN